MMHPPIGTSYDPAVAIPTLVGSLLSCIASGFIFICYMILPQAPHFRHVLILNLAGADFFNAINNSASGVFLFVHGHIRDDPKCTLNGFLGQFTVQGADFSILLIAIATVFALSGTDSMPAVTLKNKIFATCFIWTVPTITSFTALALDDYGPVSGNWCWLKADRPVLRYALNHGWRFSIILMTVILYAYLWIYFRRQFKEIRDLRQNGAGGGLSMITEEEEADFHSKASLQNDQWPGYSRFPEEDITMRNEKSINALNGPGAPSAHVWPGSPNSAAKFHDTVHISTSKALTDITSYSLSLASHATVPANYEHSVSLQRKQTEIRKVLLLNAYPIAYVILWLPGIANRIVELSGHTSRPLNIMQSSTQFIGLANAITYGYNENIKRQAQIWWQKGKGRR